MDDRKLLEVGWRKEFEDLGEDGVRHQLFRGRFQANQPKEGFAFGWLQEKQKERDREKAHRRNLVLMFALGLFGVPLIAYFGFSYFGEGEFWALSKPP